MDIYPLTMLTAISYEEQSNKYEIKSKQVFLAGNSNYYFYFVVLMLIMFT